MGPKKEPIHGVHELYHPTNGRAIVDIVAVHGLNGDAINTWTAGKDGSSVCWLSHPDFLPKYIPHARILTYGYNSSISNLTGQEPSSDRIHNHAHSLVAELCANRRLNRRQEVPIIFLCHSLGGIVVKRALSYSKEATARKTEHLHSIYTCTHSILFFGTPHHGSSKARLLATLQKLVSRAGPQKLLQNSSQLVNALEEESETLQNINDYFVPIMRRFQIYFFWEEKMTDLKYTKEYIVTKESAAPLFDETERAGLPADHSGMVKFLSVESSGFIKVAMAIDMYCGEAPTLIQRRCHETREWLAQRQRSEILEQLSSISPIVKPPAALLLENRETPPIQSQEQLEQYLVLLSGGEQRPADSDATQQSVSVGRLSNMGSK